MSTFRATEHHTDTQKNPCALPVKTVTAPAQTKLTFLPPNTPTQPLDKPLQDIVSNTNSANIVYTFIMSNVQHSGCRITWTYKDWTQFVHSKAPSVKDDFWYIMSTSNGNLGYKIISNMEDYVKLITLIQHHHNDPAFTLEAWGHTNVFLTTPTHSRSELTDFVGRLFGSLGT